MFTAGVSVAVVCPRLARPLARPVPVTRMKARTRFGAIESKRSNLDPEVGTRVLDVGEEPPNCVRAFVHPLDGRERRSHLDVLCAAGEVAIDVSIIDRGDRSLDNLHVLVRNTPSPALRMGDFMCRV